MKRSLAAVVALLTVAPVVMLGLSACDPHGKTHDTSDKAAESTARTSAEAPAANTAAPAHADAPSNADATPSEAAVQLGGAPEFAAVYPGGVVETPPTLAGGPAGPGGLVTFTTAARPDAVIGFYKQRAEAAGLASVMSMNQGDSVAYGASEAANGATLQVVATALPNAPTSVQLTWSAGQ